MFRARYKGDFETLLFLHTHFIQSENYPAALLCLDPAFVSTLPAHGTTIVDPGPELSLHLSYFKLLDRLRRGDQLYPGSMRQMIFGFQSREDDRFFIPANSYLYTVLSPRSDAAQEKGGCVATHEELKGTLNDEIPKYIYLRAKEQHNAYRRRFGINTCMAMVARGECPRQDCQFQHIRPEKMTNSWFNARIRSVLMEIRILNLTGFPFKGIFAYVLTSLHPYQMLTLRE